MRKRINDTPSRITRKSQVGEACMCKDGSYSKECCEGFIYNQGIGNITGVRYFMAKGILDCSIKLRCNGNFFGSCQ